MFLVHCLFFLLCAVTSLPIECHHKRIHVHATHVQVLSCCVEVFACSLNVYHPCHTYHYSWSLLYITCTAVPVLHVTFVYTYHATCLLCSPHVICLFQPYSTYTKPTCTCFTPTYIHLLSVVCYIPKKKTKKELLGANVSHVHGEALLRVTSAVFNSYHRGSISRFEEEAELTEDEHDYKPPSCVTVKT